MFLFNESLNVKLGKTELSNCLTMLKCLKESIEGTYYVSNLKKYIKK